MLSLLNRARILKQKGVIGLNARNGLLVMPSNPRRLYPLVDDKAKTKELATAAGIAVPELYGKVANEYDAGQLESMVEGKDQFVIKPAQGSGGDGIVVVAGRAGANRVRLVNGTIATFGELRHHISNTLSGQYSLGGKPDVALIEYCVEFDPLFEKVSYLGVPDIRVIVYAGVPVMAMVRLPTRQSGGKANLHQGAVGAGVDIAAGITGGGVLGNERVDVHPDTGASIAGLQLPGWEQILTLAARCYELVGLGYLGVDIVLDRTLGPLILELNARPGLNIQIANGLGIGQRVRWVQVNAEPELSVEERVALARRSFDSASPEAQMGL